MPVSARKREPVQMDRRVLSRDGFFCWISAYDLIRANGSDLFFRTISVLPPGMTSTSNSLRRLWASLKVMLERKSTPWVAVMDCSSEAKVHSNALLSVGRICQSGAHLLMLLVPLGKCHDHIQFGTVKKAYLDSLDRDGRY